MNYFLDKDGYKILNKGKVREHRQVMEQHIGRPLFKEEQVHHLDGNKLNNKIENLALCASNSEHLRKYHSNVWNKGKHKIYEFNCENCGVEVRRRRGKGAKFCSRSCTALYNLKTLNTSGRYLDQL